MWRARFVFAAFLGAGACGGEQGVTARAATNGVATPAPVRTRDAAPAGEQRDSTYVAALRATLGTDAELSLLSELQAASEAALLAEHEPGAVVALDPNDGRVLAVFSVPGDRGDPLLMPAQPNSTFKSFAALAALTDGVITPNSVHDCSGRYAFSGVTLICPAEHGDEDVRRALAVSCNSFFYDVGRRLDPTHLAATARAFGLDARTGIELDERTGVVPAPADEQHPVRPLVDAIGHGAYTVTLLELARAYAAIANGGHLPSLHVLDGRRRADGVRVPNTRPPAKDLSLDPVALETVRSGLTDAVAADYGKVHAFALDGYPFAGKSGGSDSPPRTDTPGAPAEDGLETDTWFVAYAPPAHPRLLVAARLERARNGRVAANVVSKVLVRARELSR